MFDSIVISSKNRKNKTSILLELQYATILVIV